MSSVQHRRDKVMKTAIFAVLCAASLPWIGMASAGPLNDRTGESGWQGRNPISYRHLVLPAGGEFDEYVPPLPEAGDRTAPPHRVDVAALCEAYLLDRYASEEDLIRLLISARYAHDGGKYKEEYVVDGCKVERKAEGGEYKIEIKCEE